MKSELGKAGVAVLILALGGAALLGDPHDASASLDNRTLLGGVSRLPSITPSPYDPTIVPVFGDQRGHTLLLMSDAKLDAWRPSATTGQDPSFSFFMMNR